MITASPRSVIREVSEAHDLMHYGNSYKGPSINPSSTQVSSFSQGNHKHSLA